MTADDHWQPDRAQQLAWQRRAKVVLDHLLDLAAADPDNLLAPADWTIASAGCQVTGWFHQAGFADREAAFTAWAGALGMEVRRHRGLADVRLTAERQAEEDGNVRIVLAARIWPDSAGNDSGEEGDAADG